jgi:hypothetical protein
MCDADGWEGGAMLEEVNGRGWSEHVPNASDEGWDGTRTDVSGYAPNDTQSTHDKRRDSRLPLHDEGVERGVETSLAPVDNNPQLRGGPTIISERTIFLTVLRLFEKALKNKKGLVVMVVGAKR